MKDDKYSEHFSPEKDKLLSIMLYQHFNFVFVNKYLCMGHIHINFIIEN